VLAIFGDILALDFSIGGAPPSSFLTGILGGDGLGEVHSYVD
jgi:hypothetical protein